MNVVNAGADADRHYSNCSVDCSRIVTECFSASIGIYNLLQKISYAVVAVVLCVNNKAVCLQGLVLFRYTFTGLRTIAVSTTSMPFYRYIVLGRVFFTNFITH